MDRFRQWPYGAQGRGQISKAAKIKVTTVFWDIGNNIHYVSQEHAM